MPGLQTRPTYASPGLQASAQSSQRLQVLHIQRIRDDGAGALTASRLLRLDQDRQAREPRIAQQAAERLHAQAALADVLVAIDAAAARLLRVVAVEHLQAFEADEAVERL